MGAQLYRKTSESIDTCEGRTRRQDKPEHLARPVGQVTLAVVENYFNYFTEIEEHFQKRRGGGLLLSTLDWALIEMWKDAGIPLEAVLRGIDVTFDHHDQRHSKTRKVNALGFCTQEVLTAAEDIKEAAVGAARPESGRLGFNSAEIAKFLRDNAEKLDRANLPEQAGISAKYVAKEVAASLRNLAAGLDAAKSLERLEDLERKLTVLEEKLFAVLLAVAEDDLLASLRADADRQLAPYRRKMPSSQVEQLQKQYVHKCLFEKHGLPRLSLFYM